MKPEMDLRRHLESRFGVKTPPTTVRSGWNSEHRCRITCRRRGKRQKRNRKLNSNMVTVCFPKSEVIISQPCI